MFFFLPKIIKRTFLSLTFFCFFLHFLPSPVSARVLVQDGVKLPLIAEGNVIGSQTQGEVLVDTQEPPSALEIIRSRSLWQTEDEENQSSPSGGFENLLNSNQGYGQDSLQTNTFADPVNSSNNNLTEKEVEDIIATSLEQFTLKPIIFFETLKVLGATSLASTTVSGPLTQDGTLLLSEGKNIDVVGDTLFLQSEGLGAIDFMAGRMKLDLEGNLVVSGQLSVAGGLKTDIISPLASEAVTVGKNLKVEGGIEAGSLSVAGKTTLSDLSVLGPANFQSFSASSYGRIKDLILDRGLIISDQGEAPAVGTATIFAGTQQVIVPNSRVTKDSRIFLAIDTSTHNSQLTTHNLLPLFVSQKLPGSYFVVSTDQIPQQDITFNWLMIN